MKRILISVILGAAFIIGCGAATDGAAGATKDAPPAGPMVGTWELQLTDEAKKAMPPDQKISLTMNFQADGKWTGNADMGSQKSAAGGTYTLDGKTLTVVTTSEDGKPKTSAKTETATLAEDMKSFALPGMETMGKLVKK